MKILVVLLIIAALTFGALGFLYINNPSVSDFDNWFKSNISDPMKRTTIEQMDNSLNTNSEFLNMIIKGAYDALLKDTVENEIDDVIIKIRNSVRIEDHVFYSNYYIYLPDGNMVTVVGFLKKFTVYE